MNTKIDSTFDLVVTGATPGGIAYAIRASREGLRVLLTQYNHHIGGLWSNGLGAMDTQYAGRRSIIYSEFCDRILAFYSGRYGKDSKQYRSVITKTFSRYSNTGPKAESDTYGRGEVPSELPDRYYGKFNFEPHTVEKIFNEMVAEEKNISLWLNCVPMAVEQQDRLLRSVLFHFSDGSPERIVEAKVFADCTYEGDLFALAGAPYRVGRESRSEFNELHAGRIFTALHFASKEEVGFPQEAINGRLNLDPYEAISQQIFAGSTGEGDEKIQAYTFRLCLSNDPNNRMMPECPSNYNREIYLQMRNRWSVGSEIPNGKLKWNTSNLPGENWEYPEADWPKRRKILKKHLDHALGFLWFLQHDEAVPETLRLHAQQYGLAKDEFTDNGHVPWEMYVREARRLVGRYIFKEQDATLGPGLQRSPIHRDSIAITEWGMDSHSVSMEMVTGSRHEGKFLLTDLTRPGQVPWRCLLPPEHDNLLVPVCLSATHVGWGTIRLEPTWMHISESAAFATMLAIHSGIPPAHLTVSKLQRKLVENGIMISFFNDFDMASEEAWVPAVQFLGAKWFFSDYNARPNEPLDMITARIWAEITVDILVGKYQHLEKKRWEDLYPNHGVEEGITASELCGVIINTLKEKKLPTEDTMNLLESSFSHSDPLTRGESCLFFYRLLKC